MGYCGDTATGTDGQTATCTRPANHPGWCKDDAGRRWQTHTGSRPEWLELAEQDALAAWGTGRGADTTQMLIAVRAALHTVAPIVEAAFAFRHGNCNEAELIEVIDEHE